MVDEEYIENYVDHSYEEAEETIDAKQPIEPEIYEEIETITNPGDQRLWVKPPDELFTDIIKEEVLDCEYQTIVDIKDEIEELEEEIKEDEVKAAPLIRCEVIKPPLDIQLPKVPIPKLHKINANNKVKKPRGRMGRRPRPILPMTRPIASASTSHVEQASTPRQIIMNSPQMPGIAYQIFLDHGKNANNPVQYTMLQPQPVFLQQTPSSVSTPSSVVISQPSMVINQSYQMTQAQISAKIPKIAPKIIGSYCPYCCKMFSNIKAHIKECWANPDGTSSKFRKIAPSTLL